MCKLGFRSPNLAAGYAANRFVEVISSDVTLDVVLWGSCAIANVPGCY